MCLGDLSYCSMEAISYNLLFRANVSLPVNFIMICNDTEDGNVNGDIKKKIIYLQVHLVH